MLHVRVGAIAAVLGGALCLVLTPIQAYVWSGEGAAPLVLACRPLLDLADDLYWGLGVRSGLTMYHFYGRMFVAVYALALVGLVALHTRQARAEGARERLWVRALAASVLVALVNDILSYWEVPLLSRIPPFGFGVESLALLVALFSSGFYGWATLRAGVVPAWAAWSLALAFPIAVLATFRLIGYAPHGAMLPLSIAIALATSAAAVVGRKRGVASGPVPEREVGPHDPSTPGRLEPENWPNRV